MVANRDYEVIIIGGSYAGLQAGMTLGRALRKVLIIDNGKPCNRQTPHSHNFLTRDGATPAQLAALAREQALQYPTVQLITDTAVNGAATDSGFAITTAAGQIFHCRKLLLAAGILDNIPAIPGFSNCWGISVIHCPYCHGYEVHHTPTGILASGDIAFQFVKTISNWTDQLTLFTNGSSPLTEAQQQQLQQRNTQVVTKEIREIVHENGYIRHLLFTDGSTAPLNALYARLSFQQHCPIPEQLGCKLAESGHLVVDNFFKTNIPGIYAAGDCVSPMRSVGVAVAGGMSAGAFINHELTEAAYAH